MARGTARGGRRRDPPMMARQRYARGEITREQYEQIVIRPDPPTERSVVRGDPTVPSSERTRLKPPTVLPTVR